MKLNGRFMNWGFAMSRNIYSQSRVVSLYGLSRTIPEAILNDYCYQIVSHSLPRTLCDVGFGKGSTLIPFASFQHVEVCGIDSSIAMYKHVREELLKRGLRARIIHADARSLPALLEEVDLVHTKAVTHMFEDPGEFLTAITKPIREGGYFVIGKEESQPEDNLEAIGKYGLDHEEDPVLREFYLTYFSIRERHNKPFIRPQMPAGDYGSAVDFLIKRGFVIDTEISTPLWSKQISLGEIIKSMREGNFTVFSKNCTSLDRETYAEAMKRFCIDSGWDIDELRAYPSKLKAMVLRKQGGIPC